jgi:hypothetical protein
MGRRKDTMTPVAYYKHQDELITLGNQLSEKYLNQKLTTPKIAKEYNVAPSTIWNWLKKFNIKVRSRRENNLGNRYSLGCKRSLEYKEGVRDRNIKRWKNVDYRKNHSGQNASLWKGGRVMWCGYVFIYNPKHPHAVQGKRYVAEHRLVMEKYLERYLKASEKVHHINGIRDDNRIENLALMKSKSVHGAKHNELFKENLFLKKENQAIKLLLISFLINRREKLSA